MPLPGSTTPELLHLISNPDTAFHRAVQSLLQAHMQEIAHPGTAIPDSFDSSQYAAVTPAFASSLLCAPSVERRPRQPIVPPAPYGDELAIGWIPEDAQQVNFQDGAPEAEETEESKTCRMTRTITSESGGRQRAKSTTLLEIEAKIRKTQNVAAINEKTALVGLIKGAQAAQIKQLVSSATLENLRPACFSRAAERRMESLMGILILVNVIQIGVSTELGRDWQGWLYIDIFFAMAFTVELICKFGVHGLALVSRRNEDWKMNLFDCVIVAVAILEVVLTISRGNSTSSGPSLSVFRMVRLLRLTRILKVLRFAIFHDLLMMLEGLMGGARTLFWAIMLLVALIYGLSITLRETLGASEDDAALVKPFSTLPWAFFTCFRCIMGDCSTADGQPLPVLLTEKFVAARNPGFATLVGVFYFSTIVVTSFGLFNVISAVYLENIIGGAKQRRNAERLRKFADTERNTMLMADLVKEFITAAGGERATVVFEGFDEDIIGNTSSLSNLSVDQELFCSLVNSPRVAEILDELDVSAEERNDLFDVLDADGSGALTPLEITRGLAQLRGDPRRSDVVGVGLVARFIRDTIEADHKSFKDRLSSIQYSIAALQYDNVKFRDFLTETTLK